MSPSRQAAAEDKAEVEQYDVGAVPLAGLPAPGSGPYKDNTLLYAAGDVVTWVGPPNLYPPVGFEDPTTITGATYKCCGWTDVSGYIFKLDETIKDIPAAGVLTPIRSILTGGVKTCQAVFLEALNPNVLALYDDVSIFPGASSPLKPAAGRTDASCGITIGSQTVTDVACVSSDVGKSISGTGIPPNTTVTSAVAGTQLTMSNSATATNASASLTIGSNTAVYVIPDPPADNRYSLIFDSIDGAKRSRLYAPFAKVTARGNSQVQQGDITMTDLTFTFYPGQIGAVQNAVAQRYIGYGKDVSAYFA
jgi:hypothetical protein